MPKNPFAKETFNLTDQLEILKSDPEAAKAMMGATPDSLAKLNPWLADYMNVTAQMLISSRSPETAALLKYIAETYVRELSAYNHGTALEKVAARMATLDKRFVDVASSVHDEICGKGGEK